MNEYNRTGFKRRVTGAERAMMMVPFNVIMVASIRGNIDTNGLSDVLNRLRTRHALLAVRVVVDEDDVAWFVTEGVPEFNLEVIPRENENQWIKRTEAEFNVPFPFEKGPLSRFILLRSHDVSELIICAHHAICDGISLIYLIKDILQYLGEPGSNVEILHDPPPIDKTTVPSPPTIRPILRRIIKLMNKRWEKKNIRFDHNDMKRLHRVFWEQNADRKLLTWIISEEMTKALVSRSREEKVTVNTALWTAFLAAQYDVQAPLKPYHQRSGMAVNTRDKLLVPVGESFGFYASSLTVRLKYTPRKDFWENARNIHNRIRTELEKTELFRMLIADLLSPSLIDSIYFSKYRLMKSRISNILLRMMNFDKIRYGYSITNVGKIDIPSVYGQLRLDTVYGPAVYSDVNEKLIGVITIGDRLSFMMTYNENNVSTDNAKHIRDAAISHLSRAISMK
jgi:NRPS condensation-like uncharacterized protein